MTHVQNARNDAGWGVGIIVRNFIGMRGCLSREYRIYRRKRKGERKVWWESGREGQKEAGIDRNREQEKNCKECN